MPEFLDCCHNDDQIKAWKALLKQVHPAYGTEKMIEVNTKMEDIESIGKIMALKPGEDKSGTD